MYAGFLLLVVRFLCVMSSSVSPLANLGPRFNRILSMVKPSSRVVADVGCDHGLLSGRIAHWDTVERVIGSDMSVAAAKGALAHYDSLAEPQRDKLELLIGDGLAPLVEKVVTDCDTLILSVMGVRVLPSSHRSTKNSRVSTCTSLGAQECGSFKISKKNKKIKN